VYQLLSELIMREWSDVLLGRLNEDTSFALRRGTIGQVSAQPLDS
jgi:hypothetical protein